MDVLELVLLIVSAVLFAIAALAPSYTKFNLIAGGLFFWVVVVAIEAAQAL